jgi:restriction system protein
MAASASTLVVKDPELMYQLNPRKWEELIAGAYELAGFDEVILTPRSGDKGRDVIAVKKGIGCIRFLEEVKAYKPDHLVTAEEVRALLGVVSADQNATKGIFTTTSDFAPRIREEKAIKDHMPFRIELVNGVELLKRLGALVESPSGV